MKKLILLCIILVSFLFGFSICCAENVIAEDETAAKIQQFDSIIEEIQSLPAAIDEDICGQDWVAYRADLTILAKKIVEANNLIKEIKIAYPIDLWKIYNRISSNPICGIGESVILDFVVADVNRNMNEAQQDSIVNSDLCPCWNLLTGREELTGFYKDGACRCILGWKPGGN